MNKYAMRNRNERLIVIRRLIGSQNISSQEELMKLLELQGFEMTQATLSRDLKYLKVAKMPDDRQGYVYILPDKDQAMEEVPQSGSGLSGLISIDFAQGMAILRTLPGHAGSIAYTIDNSVFQNAVNRYVRCRQVVEQGDFNLGHPHTA